MTTITTICKRCGRTRVTKCVDTFYSTADMWSSACGFFHGITRHWGTLSPKAHRWAPFYCVVVPLRLILALVWDLLRATPPTSPRRSLMLRSCWNSSSSCLASVMR